MFRPKQLQQGRSFFHSFIHSIEMPEGLHLLFFIQFSSAKLKFSRIQLSPTNSTTANKYLLYTPTSFRFMLLQQTTASFCDRQNKCHHQPTRENLRIFVGLFVFRFGRKIRARIIRIAHIIIIIITITLLLLLADYTNNNNNNNRQLIRACARYGLPFLIELSRVIVKER